MSTSSHTLDGRISIEEPVRIGEGVSGHLVVTARHEVRSRRAVIRLLGALIREEPRFRRLGMAGKTIAYEEWVELNGFIFEELPFLEPALPTVLAAGECFETNFNLPAPRLGPVSAHMGSAALVWALDAKWDIAKDSDERVCGLVNVKQNLDYLRSGAVRLEGGAMLDAYSSGDATITVAPPPPIVAGSEIEVSVRWPSAGSGRSGRLELQVDVDAANRLSGVVLFSQAVDPAAFTRGVTAKIPIPADAPPVLDEPKHGVAVRYRIRALVDRALRSDLAVERYVAVV